jgi:hypothetical protein
MVARDATSLAMRGPSAPAQIEATCRLGRSPLAWLR